MRIALIKDGAVENVILADSADAASAAFGPSFACVALADDVQAGPGWTWDGVAFAEPPAQ